MLQMPAKKRTLYTKAVMKLFWDHTKRYPWILFFAILGIFLNELSNVIGPLFIRNLFNLLITLSTSPATIKAIIAVFVGYTLISLMGWVGGRLEMWLGYTLIAKVTANLTREAFENLMRHSYQFFANSFSGALTRRVARFSGAYENLYYSGVTVVLEGVIYILGVAGVLLFRNWILGGIIVFWICLFVSLQWYLNKLQHPYRVARAGADTDMTATLADSISNQNTIALFSAHEYEHGLVSSAADRLRNAQLKSWNFNALVYGFQGLLTNALNIGMLAVGVWLWFEKIITLGDVVLIQAYVFGIFNSVWSLGRQFNVIYNGLADASEMVEVIQTPLEIQDAPGAQALAVSKGNIAFRDVGFEFNNERTVLSGFSLNITGGQKVALVGPSGAGKTTITKLLLRLYDVQRGMIEIDGQNIAEVTQDSLREAIAFVPQEPILFHRTLMENIRYGRRDATDEEVIEAATQAHCHEFISQLPLGYETFVGERGIKLSGGERQRVAIARAILKNAPVLVLDEATSSLDSESEALIQDALETLMRGKTVIVIAHRLSTIMKMDRIIVMEGGKVVADGTHQELLAQGGLYHKLWSIQAGGFIGGTQESKKDEEPTVQVDEALLAEEPLER